MQDFFGKKGGILRDGNIWGGWEDIFWFYDAVMSNFDFKPSVRSNTILQNLKKLKYTAVFSIQYPTNERTHHHQSQLLSWTSNNLVELQCQCRAPSWILKNRTRIFEKYKNSRTCTFTTDTFFSSAAIIGRWCKKSCRMQYM